VAVDEYSFYPARICDGGQRIGVEEHEVGQFAAGHASQVVVTAEELSGREGGDAEDGR